MNQNIFAERHMESNIQKDLLIACRRSLKSTSLFNFFFSSNLGEVNDEQGNRFHQNWKRFEERFQGRRWDAALLGNFCLLLKR